MEAQRCDATKKGCRPESNTAALAPKPASFPLAWAPLKGRVLKGTVIRRWEETALGTDLREDGEPQRLEEIKILTGACA